LYVGPCTQFKKKHTFPLLCRRDLLRLPTRRPNPTFKKAIPLVNLCMVADSWCILLDNQSKFLKTMKSSTNSSGLRQKVAQNINCCGHCYDHKFLRKNWHFSQNQFLQKIAVVWAREIVWRKYFKTHNIGPRVPGVLPLTAKCIFQSN
jgi:hypothetical protein